MNYRVLEHGTLTMYGCWGCRCEECRAASATYQRGRRQRLRDDVAAVPREPGEVVHGTTGGYGFRGCRCQECRAASAAYKRAYRKARRQRVAWGLIEIAHGTRLGYDDGCRCEECGRAQRERTARRKAAKTAAP